MKMETLSRGGIVPRLATKAILSKSSSITILPAERDSCIRVSQPQKLPFPRPPKVTPTADQMPTPALLSGEHKPQPSALPFWQMPYGHESPLTP